MAMQGLFINGEWGPAMNGEKLDSIDPATGEVLARFPVAGERETVAAIESAERAWTRWRHTPPPERGEIIGRAVDHLRHHKDVIGEMVTREMGKVIAEGRGDVQEAIDFLGFIAGEGRRLRGETTTSELPDKFAMTLRQPIGVVGCITPWNFPTAIPAWKIGAALISGNSVVFKPASQTPQCAAMLVEAFEQAGLPKGVLNLVTGPAGRVGRELVENPRVRAVSFTGGVPAGTDVYTRAAKLLKPVELELGGKNPQLVMDDADIELAIEGVLFGAFGSAGQRCTATSRLVIHKDVYDRVLERLLERTAELRVGDPLDETIDMGPLSSQQQLETVLGYIDSGRDEGAELLAGGNKLGGASYDRGFFVEPTVFAAEHGMRITREEIFGPLLAVLRAEDYGDAVRIANDVDYGLAASIYTRDINTAQRAIRDLDAGVMYVNAPTIGAEVHLPFGGLKHSGNGGREAGSAAIEEFTEIKTVFIDYSGRLQKAQIRD